jgi:hypothetical protein
MCSGEVSALEIRSAEVGAFEMRLSEIGAFEMCPGEVGAPKIDFSQVEPPVSLPLAFPLPCRSSGDDGYAAMSVGGSFPGLALSPS